MSEGSAPEAPGSRSARHDARRPASPTTMGWGPAVVRALVAAGAALALAEALAFLAMLASGGSGPSALVTAKLGDVLFLWFHHAGLVFRASARPAGSVVPGPALSFGFTLSLAVMGGTLLAGWLLVRGGRAVAASITPSEGASPGEEPHRRGLPRSLVAGLHGSKVAVPYAALCLAASFGARFAVGLPNNAVIPSRLSVHPDPVSAFLWPLVIAGVAGFAGGLRDAAPHDPDPWDRRLRAAVDGGARMLATALVAAFAGLLVLGAVHPSATRAYFDAVFRRGLLRGVTLLAATALATPNLAAWVLFPSMGSCLGVGGASSVCALSYRHFPGGGTVGGAFGRLLPSGQAGPAPAGYLLFLLVPVVAVVFGGATAAARARARSRREAALAAAAAGVVFAALCVVLVGLSSITGTVEAGLGRTTATTFHLGPDVAASILLCLAWGVIGGAVGGLAHGSPAAEPPVSEGPD